jgi:hypothetical protein
MENFNVSNTLFVDENATPNTGVKGLATSPFHDLDDAIASAEPGDFIFHINGDYTIQI